jgi:MinD-like ATPase involved in chromosome partitioning or flagellar assembly
MRPDQQDYQGTSITVALARKLGAAPALVINMIPPVFEESDVAETAASTYNVPVWATIPHSQEVLSSGSSKLIYLSLPEHTFSQRIEQLYGQIAQKSPVLA